MPLDLPDRRDPPRLLVGFFYLFLPVLKPILKATLKRNERVWRRLQALRDRLMDAPPLPVGLRAGLPRRLYAGLFYSFASPLRVALKHTVGRNQWAWRRLKTLHRRIIEGPRAPAAAPRPSADNGRPSFGVNVAGYLSSYAGTGEAARSTVRLLEAAGIPCILNNVVGPGSSDKDARHSQFRNENPYALNLIYVNPDQVANFAWERGGAYFQGRYNIGAWNWELESFPEKWLQRFRYYDEIWVASGFVGNALARVSSLPIVRIPYAIQSEVETAAGLDRPRLGLAAHTFLVLFVFDFHSIFERKNPLALIEAFKRAFRPDDDAMLLMKATHADRRALRAMRQTAGQANVQISDAVLSRQEMNTLYALCDCYVSLHRSEGFGLTLAEAMRAGKPAIATAYGGNTDFMTAENSYPVRYELAEIDRDHGPYKKGWLWADPDIDHAGELLRRVYENREEARAIGRKAREQINELFNPNVVGDLMKRRLMSVASLNGLALPSQGERDLSRLTSPSAHNQAEGRR